MEEQLCDRIKRLMAKNDMRASDLAKKSGISKQLLSQILRGEISNPRLNTMIALAIALNVDMNTIGGFERHTVKMEDNNHA